MQSIFFARDKDGKDISIFDAKNGLACECTCIDCGKPLVANQGTKNAWCFKHKSIKDCSTSEETSLHRLIKNIFKCNTTFTVPEVGYLFGKRKELLEESRTETIVGVDVETTLDIDGVKFRPDTVLTLSTGEKLYLEICVSHKCTSNKISAYRSKGYMALELRLKSSDFDLCRSVDDLKQTVQTVIDNEDYTITWLSHPKYNDNFRTIENDGARTTNSLGLGLILCPDRDDFVRVSDCKKCPFCDKVSKTEVHCLGNLARFFLRKTFPSVILPKDIKNYTGRCEKCDSNKTRMLSGENTLEKVCSSCGYVEELRCPKCGQSLSLSTSSKRGTISFGGKFIGCDSCDFTLTYTDSNGNIADETSISGGLNNLYKDIKKYDIDVMKYRRELHIK